MLKSSNFLLIANVLQILHTNEVTNATFCAKYFSNHQVITWPYIQSKKTPHTVCKFISTKTVSMSFAYSYRT